MDSVIPSRFIPKGIYFVVFFKDENLTLPVIRTLVYDRSIMRECGNVRHIFQAILFDNEEPVAHFVDDEDAEEFVLNAEGLLTYLSECFSNHD